MGSDAAPEPVSPAGGRFQFTLPRGERQLDGDLADAGLLFQFTLPRGERHDRANSLLALLAFQFTLPRGERPTASAMRPRNSCFNSRSRVGSDGDDGLVLLLGQVSIHAPAWGATLGANPSIGAVGVSIHAPAWGATGKPPRMQRFDPVSIHAPAWGATEPITARVIRA